MPGQPGWRVGVLGVLGVLGGMI
ncbi:hypothetical protein FAIPA1_90038 [Frankia sp. AiPs1]